MADTLPIREYYSQPTIVSRDTKREISAITLRDTGEKHFIDDDPSLEEMLLI